MQKDFSGKVRDIYDISDDRLVIVTTDRVSAFDVVLPTPIPDKGRVLNAISTFWFGYTEDIVPNHMISTDLADMPAEFRTEWNEGRTALVKKCKMLPFEFIVRGFMFGSMWSSYQKTGTFSGFSFPAGMHQAQRLETPILTPSSKAQEGHDEYITFADVAKVIGDPLAKQIEEVGIALYRKCYDYAYSRGIILADTKFEFGLDEGGKLVLCDELFTPDSSRFWSADTYREGTSPASLDKQLLRDWLIENRLNGVTPAPEIPEDVVRKTQEKYFECRDRLLK